MDTARIFFSGFAILLFTHANAQNLKSKLLEIQKNAGGTLGVYAMHVEKGLVASLHESQFFPMASVYKLPIGVCFLNQVFEKKINLTDSVSITGKNIAPEFSPLMRRWKEEGDYSITYGELLRWMVSESDNTACDVLLAKVGGASHVNRYFSQMGLNGFTVNRTEKQLALDHVTAGSPHLHDYSSLETDSILATFNAKQRTSVVRYFLTDRKDVASPRGIADLLLRIHKRSLAGFKDYPLLMQMLTETPTGLDRIKAGIPADAVLAHKTGTHRTLDGINIATNDVGIIQMGRGNHIILVVMLKGSSLDSAGREGVIADVARAVCSAWLK